MAANTVVGKAVILLRSPRKGDGGGKAIERREVISRISTPMDRWDGGHEERGRRKGERVRSVVRSGEGWM